MMATSFTKLLEISAPIQLAGMPGVTTNALVCAVANAGESVSNISSVKSAADIVAELVGGAEKPRRWL